MTLKQFYISAGVTAGLLSADLIDAQTVNASWINFTDSGASGLAHLFYDSPSSSGVGSYLALENTNGGLFFYGSDVVNFWSNDIVEIGAVNSVALYSDTLYLGAYGGTNSPKITIVNSNGYATADIMLTPKGGGRLIVSGGSTFNGSVIFSTAPTVGGSSLITQSVLNSTLASYVQTNASGHVGVGGSAADEPKGDEPKGSGR